MVGLVVGCLVIGGRSIGASVVRGFNNKNMFEVLISHSHFGRGLFCYSNFNFFYIDDEEETVFINYS